MDTFWAILLVQAFVFGGFCAFIANEKNRDSAGWFFLGFLFSLVAVLALIAVPKLDKRVEPARPPMPYVPPSPPVPTKTKTIRLILIFGGIILFLLIIYLMKHILK